VHDGEEFVFVLDGTVALEIGGERFELEPGDSAYYLSTTPHLIAAKKNKATILPYSIKDRRLCSKPLPPAHPLKLFPYRREETIGP